MSLRRRRPAALVFSVVFAIAAQALICGGCVETDLTWREKRAERRLRADVLAEDRFVDISAVLRVVVQDPNGAELIPGKPKLRVLRQHPARGSFGGVLDTRTDPPRLVATGREPVIWYCSEDQETILLHDDPKIPGQLIWGSEGAGKTRVLALLHYFWWLELIGQHAEVGQTAPTKKRLKHVLGAMTALFPARWFKYLKNEQQAVFADGHTVQFVSTKKQSEAQGSPAQGYSWKKAGRDELQDQCDADEDIESRGRDANIDPRIGALVFHQAATCTAKQAPEFRDLTARKLSSGRWIKRTLLIARSPFIHPSFLEEKKLVMTEREYRRRYLCEDLPPEGMVYFNWSRADNLRPIPSTAKRVTSLVLAAKLRQPYFHLLAGHDPGASKAATVYLDAYECGCPHPRICKCGLRELGEHAWWVRGERFTQNHTSEQHAKLVLEDVQNVYGYNRPGRPERVHVRAHPYGQSEEKPSLNLYRVFERVGLHTKAAQFRQDGTGTGLIRKEDRFELVNRLLCDAAGRRRLFVEATKQGTPTAPRLVEAFETMERDERGLAEHEKKNEHDKSDPPAALGYAVWPFEKETASHLREVMQRRRAEGAA